MKRLITILLTATGLILIASCESTNDASELIVPDRDKEGFSGPGVRVAGGDQMNTNRLERITQTEYTPADRLRQQQEQAVDGIDLFQFKKKF